MELETALPGMVCRLGFVCSFMCNVIQYKAKQTWSRLSSAAAASSESASWEGFPTCC